MHLLKQPTQDNPSLPQLVREIVKGRRLGRKFMYRLALRSYGLLNGFVSWGALPRYDDDVLGAALLQSAIVNLEQTETASNTPLGELNGLAARNLGRWHSQVGRWQPRAIVCGGTFPAVWRALGKPPWATASTGLEYFMDPKIRACVYLDAPHPTARFPLPMVHTYLMAGLQGVLPGRSLPLRPFS